MAAAAHEGRTMDSRASLFEEALQIDPEPMPMRWRERHLPYRD